VQAKRGRGAAEEKGGRASGSSALQNGDGGSEDAVGGMQEASGNAVGVRPHNIRAEVKEANPAVDSKR
jgi:hypothetical protein